MSRIVQSIESLEVALESMKPWPGMPEGTRAIVSRRISEDEFSETLVVLGYLRVGVPCFPVSMLFDSLGIAMGKTFKAGDFIDSYDTFNKMPVQIVKRAAEPVHN